MASATSRAHTILQPVTSGGAADMPAAACAVAQRDLQTHEAQRFEKSNVGLCTP